MHLFFFQNEIFGTARVAAVYLKHVLKLEKKVFIVGGEGIAEEIRNVGLEHLPIGVSIVQFTFSSFFYLHIFAIAISIFR